MTVEVLEAEEVQFEAEGGSKGWVAGMVMHAFTWLSIGALFHWGWRIAG